MYGICCRQTNNFYTDDFLVTLVVPGIMAWRPDVRKLWIVYSQTPI